MDEIKELTDKVIQFRDDRNWQQFHNPKDLALSLSLEASELLENFQWQSSNEAVTQKREDMKEELADVLMYALLFAHEIGVDIKQAIEEKIQKNNEKYPVEKAYGVSKKYTEL
ncbi:nucleotide pyrophosphohydrolase [Bacillus sp. S4]|uniref:nucleotide pyrophosphohydrolase n=1 Tax=Bacillus TaxID=1386 RepID=UPI0018F30250|nr:MULTISPECIES: nucleotide pyrophosphohydrolase [Bacillus cereus group]MBJ7987440.1 nucleotide pyrophosphohydrolase [Bacillus cereus]MBJ8094385.1 nucleotide pyrophosphohydrolase [Bacillus cereus]MCQ6358913.1 nucleotide pyrophosphohydrolase [Bacillus cereus]CAH2461730.1 MazG-like family [Bacillus mycoides KBAB4]